jgi:hypothetical protein
MQEALRTLLCVDGRAEGGAPNCGPGKRGLVSIVSEGAAGLLFHMRIIVVL